MIEELQHDSWVLGALEHPFGRGMNLQIECADVMSWRKRIEAAGIGVYREIEEAWYQTATGPVGHLRFLVADPDGYLLRFCQVLSARWPGSSSFTGARSGVTGLSPGLD